MTKRDQNPMDLICATLAANPKRKEIPELQSNVFSVDDIEWSPHDLGMEGKRARIAFDNGYAASVITGPYFYSTEEAPYEVGVMEVGGGLTYDTPITNDVLGYQTKKDVEKLLKDISELPSRRQ